MSKTRAKKKPATKKSRAPAKPKNRRGSPEAIEKRKAARRLNTLLGGRAGGKTKLDGRTERRRLRLIEKLTDSSKMKPLQVLQAANDLMDMGESVPSLKRAGVRIRKTTVSDEAMVEARRVQSAYDFHPEAWLLLGIKLLPKAA